MINGRCVMCGESALVSAGRMRIKGKANLRLCEDHAHDISNAYRHHRAAKLDLKEDEMWIRRALSRLSNSDDIDRLYVVAKAVGALDNLLREAAR